MNKNIKSFNTEGPCIFNKNYMLPSFERLTDVKELIKQEKYFVLQAPRQSGKTTCIQDLADKINEKSENYALYCSLEELDDIENPSEARSIFLSILNDSLLESPIPEKEKTQLDIATLDPNLLYRKSLSKLSTLINKHLVIFFDEADCLSEKIVISFLRQIRTGYIRREKSHFPISIALIGLRPIREYKHRVRDESKSVGSAKSF